MKFFVPLLLVLVCSGFCRASEMTAEVLREINLARTAPRAYAEQIAESSPPSSAQREAIDFLHRAKPRLPITLSELLSGASREHVDDQGPRGSVGHRGTNGSSPWNRLAHFGVWQGAAGEVIAYGRHTARDAVVALIVDDGVPNRAHRKHIFDPAFSVAGVAWGAHARWGTMCVVDFAGSFTAGGGGKRPRLARAGF